MQRAEVQTVGGERAAALGKRPPTFLPESNPVAAYFYSLLFLFFFFSSRLHFAFCTRLIHFLADVAQRRTSEQMRILQCVSRLRSVDFREVLSVHVFGPRLGIAQYRNRHNVTLCGLAFLFANIDT